MQTHYYNNIPCVVTSKIHSLNLMSLNDYIYNIMKKRCFAIDFVIQF